MLQSTHYELKLVEGSDIVNPLVIDRPNYEAIDGVMYENESKSIGDATELKSGTIHALTRTKGNQRFFCFTATSNYDAGDTFTVDSVPVTALLPNGTALPDNAYVVNGTVLCSLIGTLLTVYSVGSAIADDAIRFGGELPAYYATASDLATVETTANAASTLSINNSNQISEINSKLADVKGIKIIQHSLSNVQVGTGVTFIDALAETDVPTGYYPIGVQIDTGNDIVYSLSSKVGGNYTVRGMGATSTTIYSGTVNYILLKTS